MKKITLAIFCCLSSLCQYAQDPPIQSGSLKQDKFYIGWELSFKKSYLKKSTDFRLGKIVGYEGALCLLYKHNEKIGLLNSLCYERMGAYSEGLEVNYRFDYMKLAVCPLVERIVCYLFHSTSEMGVCLVAGASPGLPEAPTKPTLAKTRLTARIPSSSVPAWSPYRYQ